jgi:hypothetical protein
VTAFRVPYLDAAEREIVFAELARKVEVGESLSTFERGIVGAALRGLAADVAPGVTFERDARRDHGPATAAHKLAAAEAGLSRLAEEALRRPLRQSEKRERERLRQARTRAKRMAHDAYRAAWRRGELGRDWLLTDADVEAVLAEIVADPLSGMTPEAAREFAEARREADLTVFRELTGWPSPP